MSIREQVWSRVGLALAVSFVFVVAVGCSGQSPARDDGVAEGVGDVPAAASANEQGASARERCEDPDPSSYAELAKVSQEEADTLTGGSPTGSLSSEMVADNAAYEKLAQKAFDRTPDGGRQRFLDAVCHDLDGGGYLPSQVAIDNYVARPSFLLTVGYGACVIELDDGRLFSEALRQMSRTNSQSKSVSGYQSDATLLPYWGMKYLCPGL